MILQSLYHLYQRLQEDDSVEIAPPGFQHVDFDYAIQLREDGAFAGFLSLADEKGNLRRYLVPPAVKKSVNVSANLLWEKPSYVFRLPKSEKERDQKRATSQVESFVARIREVFGDPPEDPGVAAVLTFLERGQPEPAVLADPLWEEIKEKGRYLCFFWGEDSMPVSRRPSVMKRLREAAQTSPEAGTPRQCLVTGSPGSPCRLHPAIKNVWGAQPAGANIVAFDKPAFRSLGKMQGDNAPISEEAAFAYTTALNHLLRKGSAQRMQVGDASTVFWADPPGHPAEDEFAALFNPSGTAGPKADTEAEAVQHIRDLLSAVRNGVLPKEDDRTGFFVLGLGPNAGRIAIRFWHEGSVNEMRQRIARHFEDIATDAGPRRSAYPPLYFLLRSTAQQGKADNIAPNLGGNVMRAILSGLPYPRQFMTQALVRARAEQNVTQERAAVFKACVNRMIRTQSLDGKELTMALDETQDNIGYLLGRLFAVYERTQEGALGSSVNATLRDRFYGAASSTPSTVMPWLQRMNGHHLRKLARERKGMAVNLEKLIGAIMEKIPASGIPGYLAPEDQCRFGVGYYHQKQKFFEKKSADTESEPQPEEEPSHV